MFRMPNQLRVLCYCLILTGSCGQSTDAPDLIIHNASVYTSHDYHPYATAFAVTGNKFTAIGQDSIILQLKGRDTEIIDARGQFITPGFIDSHVHLMTGGRSLLSVDLRDASSPEEFAQRVGDFAATVQPGEWILEGNWDHTMWGGALPDRTWIDSVTGDVPVLLFRLDWHMALANTAALTYVGLDKSTPNMDGGEIIKDKDGRLTGLLKDNAMNLVMDKMPPMSVEYKERAFTAAVDYFLSNGVTTVHDVDGLNGDFESYSTALKHRAADDQKVRIYGAGVLAKWEEVSAARQNDDDWLRLNAVKGFVDGSLGSHTAAFHDHYSDKEDDKGFFINPDDKLEQWITAADSAGLHVLVHAIGDSANHVLLDIFERVAKDQGPEDRRFRIEHAQHLLLSDIGRFAAQGVIPSMQPYHAIDDGRWAEHYIGAERIKSTYAFRSLLDAGARVTFGSDWAVAPAAPISGIYAAVTRRTLDDENPDGWVPEQKISVADAIRAYTIDAAYASFDESIKGSIEVGKLADFVILDQDLTKIDPNRLLDVQVIETWVDGSKVYTRN